MPLMSNPFKMFVSCATFRLFNLITFLLGVLIFVQGQCPTRNFTRYLADTSAASVFDEVSSRNRRECSVICAKSLECMGFTGGGDEMCLMFYNISRDTIGTRPVWIEDDVPASCKWYLDRAQELGQTLLDGLYDIWYDCQWIKVFCDMTADGGGWTLLLTNTASGTGWNFDNIRERNIGTPGLNTEYSMLRIGDGMRQRSRAWNFEYRMEITGRGRWGGIWRAPRHYSLIDETGTQTGIDEVAMFDSYTYDDEMSIGFRVPWICTDHVSALFTTKGPGNAYWFGTLVMREDAPSSDWGNHAPAPLMVASYNLVNGQYKTHVSPIYYWFRMD